MAALKVGAVSYHPRVVTIWERFRTYFADAGLPTDYVLYSNYESLVEAVLAGEVGIGWNTNTAYVTLDHRAGGRTRILGMRDVDEDWATVLVMRRGESIDAPAELNGRTLALGSRDSGHAAILPLHYLAEAGLHAERDCELLRFDTDLGKHGDTGDSELRVVRAVSAGDAEAGALSDVYFSAFRADGLPEVAELEVAWRSPTYNHCNFTVLDGFDEELGARWSEALLAGPLPPRGEGPPLRAGGELHTGDWRVGAPPPEHADPGAGFAPLGAVVEAGATGYAWPLGERDALWAGGQVGYALASTELSLRTLLEERDFTASSLLLNVLGEGTLLDLLKFVGAHAPDAATAVAARLAHRDERRHVHFGVSHIRRATDRDPELRGALVAAAEARAAKLISLSGLSPVLLESLTILSADSLQPAELGEAAAQVRHLTRAMERNRIRRLRACGFDAAAARHISDLHTPNLM